MAGGYTMEQVKCEGDKATIGGVVYYKAATVNGLDRLVESLEAEVKRLRERLHCTVKNLKTLEHDRPGENDPDEPTEPGRLDGPLWAKVSNVIGYGSTLSRQLCRDAGEDPDYESNAVAEGE